MFLEHVSGASVSGNLKAGILKRLHGLHLTQPTSTKHW